MLFARLGSAFGKRVERLAVNGKSTVRLEPMGDTARVSFEPKTTKRKKRIRMKLEYSLPALVLAAAAGAATAEDDPAVARTVEQVKMLDALYKNAVVLITEHYVENPSSLSAATASKLLFAAMKKNGFHEVRLLGLTDQLTNPEENSPKGNFEETAKEKLLSGEESYKRVINEGGKRYLYMATGVPVVMEKCVMCHANFKGKTGPIGALAYKVPVIE
jgi:hypothetical protein